MEEENSLYNENDNVATLSNTVNRFNGIHNRNDICLNISPFDSFKRISLYQLNDDDTFNNLDVNRGEFYNYYLQFGKDKKTVIVNEFKDIYTENEEIVITSPNELIFKITQDKAKEILSLNDDVFYLIREIIIDNTRVLTQELFSGRWSDSTEYESLNYQSIIDALKIEIKRLTDSLSNANQEILYLNAEISKLQQENSDLMELTSYKDKYEELQNKIDQSNEYEATDLTNATYINITNQDKNVSESELKQLHETIYNPTNSGTEEKK